MSVFSHNGKTISDTNPLPTKVSGDNVGYSTDVKPVNANKGDSFLELDTKQVHIYDGTQWVVF